jgi:RNA methyltransferase, TrmH family
VKAVARLSGRSARERAGRFLVEGPQAVREAVAETVQPGTAKPGTAKPGTAKPGTAITGGAVRELYATAEAARRHPEILARAAGAGVETTPVTDEVFAAMVAGAGAQATQAPQGLLAVCDLIAADLAGVATRRPALVAVLSQVRDPGNAGTVIRVADAAGADAVVLTGSSVDVHNPKTVRASAGSVFHLPVVTGVDLEVAVSAFRNVGLAVLAADGAGAVDLDALQDAPTSALAGPVAWIFGNEAWGLPAADRALADQVVRVPVHGRAESLNLATAAAVCLYATARAHRTLAESFSPDDPAAGSSAENNRLEEA